MSSTDLYRAVRVYELRERLPEPVGSQLSLSHYLAVLGLAPERQETLLARARQECWSVRHLRKATADAGGPEPTTGRPRTTPVMKTLERVLASEHAFDGLESLLGLSKKEASQLLEACRRARAGLDGAEQRLRQVAFQTARARVLVVDSNQPFAARVRSLLRQ